MPINKNIPATPRVSPSSPVLVYSKNRRNGMVAELVETSRLWGRIAARIDPEWVEPVAQHLIKRTYSEPHWERAQGAVMATEKSHCLWFADCCRAQGQLQPDRSGVMS
ncbi:hypothetical protein ACLBR5_19595 [Escherichia coli]